jgi:leucine-rich repeat protein SHOC2
MSDEDILRLWRERCPALRELWPAEADASTWEGVTFGGTGVDGARRVVRLKLEGKLGGAVEVPAEIGGLSALTWLELDSNKLTSVPAALGNLSALTHLYLNSNQLTSVPVEIGRLSALTLLDLESNQLMSVPAALGALSALETLDIRKNLLMTLPAELACFRALGKEFKLDNSVTIIGSKAAAGCGISCVIC